MPGDPLDVLKDVWGYHDFRGPQRAIIEHVLGGGSGLVLMPTGGGKSLCYQVPALIMDGVGVVVSPLIALMQDQVEALRQNGVDAHALNSATDASTIYDLERRLERGEMDLVYLSPERLLQERTLALLERSPVALFAIDEAHCVSQWGHDFRPEYQQLSVLHERFPQTPRLALTATADAPTRDDVVQRLALTGERDEVFVSGFDRPNIRYTVVPKSGPTQQLLGFLKRRPSGESGIVYRMTRKKVDETAEFLRGHGYDAMTYHAGMDSGERDATQRRFLQDDGVIIVATIAFGMGIDKPDVRFVAHLDLPKSVEAYYQETGRAGRDGLPSEAFMAYGLQDAVTIRGWIENGNAPDEQQRVEHQKLNALLGYCESTTCRRAVLLRYFGDEPSGPCGNCDVCLDPPVTYDGLIVAQKALSCVYRTGQRYGAGYLADVLVGSVDARIRQNGHDVIPTFGVGADLPKTQWIGVLRQLVAQGFLHVDSQHGGMSLTEPAGAVLKGDAEVRLRKEQPKRKQRGERGARVPRPSVEELLEDAGDRALFDRLRSRRAALAKQQSVPAYVVFPDRTLIEMAKARPGTLQAMAGVNGVGAKKLEQYGATFLAVIQEGEGGDAAGDDVRAFTIEPVDG